MRFMRSIGAMLVALTVVAVASANAGPNGNKPIAARGLDVLAKAMEKVTDLSDQQKQDTKAVLADAEAQLVALRDETKSADKADRAARKAAREKAAEIISGAKTQIEEKLSDPQKETFRAALKTLREEAAAKRTDRVKDGTKSKRGKKDAPDKNV